jgi:aspartate aminotransferase
MKLSKRAELIPASPIRKLADLAVAAEKKGIKIYRLNIGQPDILPPDSFFKFLHKFPKQVIPYSHSRGELNFLNQLKIYIRGFGIKNAGKKNFVATNGGSEAILWSIMAVANPGDEIIVFEPFYTNYNSLAIMAGVKLIPIRTYIENSFHLPKREEIVKKISKKTKAILIANPNNPTGTVYTSKELELLIKICQKHQLFLLSDEAYRYYSYDGHCFISSLKVEEKLIKNDAKSLIILMDSFSKNFSLCGLRLGFVFSRNLEIIQAMYKFAQARLSASGIGQQIIALLLAKDQKFFKQINKTFLSRRNILITELKKIPDISFSMPEGAFYTLIKLPVKDSEKFCRWLLTDFQDKKETIMLTPAAGFYLTPGLGKDEVRVAYVLEEAKLKRAMEILGKALAAYKK